MKHLLIVDDTGGNFRSVCALLEKHGYRVRENAGEYDVSVHAASETGDAPENGIAHRKQAESTPGADEERYRSIFENSLDAILLTSPDGSIHHANPAACRMFGRTEEEICAYGRNATIDSSDPRLVCALKERERTGRFFGELTCLRKDGSKFPCELSSGVFRDAEDRLVTSMIIRDISSYKNMEALLERKAEEWQRTFDATHDAIWILGKDFKIQRVNKATRRFFNREFDELIGRQCWEVVHKAQNPVLGCPCLRAGYTLVRETMQLEINGKHVQLTVDPILDASGEFLGAVHILSDITERKTYEATRLRFLQILEASLNELYVFDPRNLRFQYINRGAQFNLGYSWQELRKMTPLDIKPEFNETTFRQKLAPLLTNEQNQVIFITVHRRADGSLYPVEVHLQIIELNDEKLFLAVIMDITERKRTESEKEKILAQLSEREIQYRNLADSGLALIWASGADTKCTYFNQPWLKFTGRTLEQELGDGWSEGVHPDDLGQCMSTYCSSFNKREPFDMEYRLRHASGEYRWIRDMGTPNYGGGGEFRGYIGHCFDITEQKRTEEQIRKLNEDLERKVLERTVELRQNIAQLEELNRVFIGRELKMAELKEKIAVLEKRIHQAE